MLRVGGQAIKAGKLLSDSTMNRSTRLGGKTIHYHSYLAHVLSIRIPVKIVVTELEDHSRAILTNTDTQAFGREDHPIRFPPMVDRIILQIRKTEPFSV